MKKLVLAIAVGSVLAIGGTSCSSKTETVDASVLTSKIENCTNTDSLQLYVAQAKQYAEQLVKDGKAQQAKDFLDRIEPVVKEKSPAMASTLTAASGIIDKAVDAVKKGTDTASDAVKDAAEATGDKIEDVAEATGDKATEIKDATVDKTKEIAGKTADKATEIKDATVDKTKEIAGKTADKAKEVKDAVVDKTKEITGSK